MTSRVFCLAIDCRDTAVLTDFWCATLGYEVVRRWTDSRGTEYVELGSGDEPIVLLQPVHEPKSGKNRLHLDIAARSGTRDSEVERLVGLGATVVSAEPDYHWVVMADPEGNEFCVLPPRP
ncbi:MAG TPA: VOC family protein [Actinophytocola sp.]|jgi:catechol 2,3-dioxygenase-like lactoylglutathione lyase family enzyme|nr:VOC family protein [Actinophytocola sp.]